MWESRHSSQGNLNSFVSVVSRLQRLRSSWPATWTTALRLWTPATTRPLPTGYGNWMDSSSLLLFRVLPEGQRCCECFSYPFPPKPPGTSGIRDCILGYDTTVMGRTALPQPHSVCSMKCLVQCPWSLYSLGALCFRAQLLKIQTQYKNHFFSPEYWALDPAQF